MKLNLNRESVVLNHKATQTTAPRVKTGVKAGGLSANHNQTPATTK